jgi:preprotein translocase subunit SecA
MSELAESVAAKLGLSVALLPERADAVEKNAGLRCGYYIWNRPRIRVRLSARSVDFATAGSGTPGRTLLRQLDPASSSQRLTMQRGLIYAVVDEADSVLIDDASSPLVLSFGSNDRAPDADAHLTAKALAEQLKQGEEFLLETSTGRIALTESGVRRCYADDVAIPVLQLVRPWTEYVQQALRARYLFRRDVHYVVQNGEVRIVDETTGRIFEDRSWQDGLHQAIEASQDLKIVAEKYSVAQVTRQRFFRLYENLSGMTGTAVGCERELHDVYSLQVKRFLCEFPHSVLSIRRDSFRRPPRRMPR